MSYAPLAAAHERSARHLDATHIAALSPRLAAGHLPELRQDVLRRLDEVVNASGIDDYYVLGLRCEAPKPKPEHVRRRGAPARKAAERLREFLDGFPEAGPEVMVAAPAFAAICPDATAALAAFEGNRALKIALHDLLVHVGTLRLAADEARARGIPAETIEARWLAPASTRIRSALLAPPAGLALAVAEGALADFRAARAADPETTPEEGKALDAEDAKLVTAVEAEQAFGDLIGDPGLTRFSACLAHPDFAEAFMVVARDYVAEVDRFLAARQDVATLAAWAERARNNAQEDILKFAETACQSGGVDPVYVYDDIGRAADIMSRRIDSAEEDAVATATCHAEWTADQKEASILYDVNKRLEALPTATAPAPKKRGRPRKVAPAGA